MQSPDGRVKATGPTPLKDRALAPDLARGGMLLLIALGNAHVFIYGTELGLWGYPLDENVLDRVITFVQALLVDARAYPLFGLLVGYGIVQVFRRERERGWPAAAARQLIRRRSAWMIILGFLHAALLYSGDILGAYGLLGIALAWVLTTFPDRALLALGGQLMILPVALGALAGLPGPERTAFASSHGIADPLVAMTNRIGEWLVNGLTAQSLVVFPAVLFGAWAARLQLLERPDRYLALLRRSALIGLGLAGVGGLPLAVMAAGLWRHASPVAQVVASAAHTFSGFAGAIGYGAVAALIAAQARNKPSRLLKTLAAYGQRSLTFYLGQSVVFVALLAPCGGGLGNRLGVAAVAAIAVLVWIMLLLPALLMDRRGYRGPAELILRRLSYAGNVRAQPDSWRD